MTGRVMLSAAVGGRRSRPRSGAWLGLLAGLGCATTFACWADLLAGPCGLWVQAAGRQRWLVGWARQWGRLRLHARMSRPIRLGHAVALGRNGLFHFLLFSKSFLFLLFHSNYTLGLYECIHV